jgi:hypothetical protein
MRFVQRPHEPPPALAEPSFAEMRRAWAKYIALDQLEGAQTRPPDRHLPKSPELELVLRELFKDKCAFCERRDRLLVYRFRPTSDATPGETVTEDVIDSSKLPRFHRPLSPLQIGMMDTFPMKTVTSELPFSRHYGWLADAWQNLYPICSECRPREPNFFPVASGRRCSLPTQSETDDYAKRNNGDWRNPPDEEPVLLDPCRDDPGRHLRALGDGKWAWLSDRGEATITQFRLNRDELVARRRAALGSSSTTTIPDTAEYAFFLRNALAGERIAAPPVSPKRPRRPRVQLPPVSPKRWLLASLEIRNFKAVEELAIDLPPMPINRAAALAILGENATGKSSILEALALCLVSDAARRKLIRNNEEFLLNPLFMGDGSKPARAESTVTATFVSVEGDIIKRKLKLTKETVSVTPDTSGLPPVFAYGAFRHYLGDHRRPSPERGVVSLFRSDNLLSKPEKWLIGLPQSRFDEVIGALRDVLGLQFSHIEREKGNCMVVTKIDGVELRTPLSAVSSGFRTILALMCDAMRWMLASPSARGLPLSKLPALILIDEVEAHLHPRWKLNIMESLRRALPRATFIITTHDPLCLRGMLSGEVKVLSRRSKSRKDKTTLPVLVETLEDLPDMAELTIDQLLTADFFGLADTDDQIAGIALSELVRELKRKGTAPATDNQALLRFRRELRQHLPVGRTDIHRLIEDAVADYLQKRSRIPHKARRKLRETYRKKIVDLLEKF